MSLFVEYESEDAEPCSQQPATELYTEPVET
jgi:hypothetical protein